MSDDRDRRSHAYQKELNIAFQRLVAAHEDVVEEEVKQGSPHAETHESLEHAVITMRSRLKPFIKNPENVKVWKQEAIHMVPAVCAQKIQTEGGEVDEFGIPSKPKIKTKRAPVEQLKRWAEVMVSIYCDLGFAPEVEQGEQQTKIDADLLQEVNEWREQNL